VTKGQRKIYVVGETGEQREYSLPRGVHINVQEGEKVKPASPSWTAPATRTTFWMCSARRMQKYLVNEIQEVYRLQGVISTTSTWKWSSAR